MNHSHSRVSDTRTGPAPRSLSPFRGEISERLQAADLERRKVAFDLPFLPPTLWRRLQNFLRTIGL